MFRQLRRAAVVFLVGILLPTTVRGTDCPTFEQLEDTAPPDTTLVSGPPTPTTDNTPTFEFTASEAPATFECSVDAAPFTVCTTPFTTAALVDGSHNFAVRAIDAVGNVDPSPATAAFFVDATGPELALVSPTDGMSTQSATVNVAISVADLSPAVTVSASDVFPSGSTLAIGNNAATLNLSPGLNIFTTFAADALGNQTLFTFTLILDNDPPSLTFLNPQAGDSVHFSPVDTLISVSEDVTVTASNFIDTNNDGMPGPFPMDLAGGEQTVRLVVIAPSSTYTASFVDLAGNAATFTGSLVFEPNAPPAPVIVSPDPAMVNMQPERTVVVTGTASGNAAAVRISAANSVTVPVNVVTGGNFAEAVNLSVGANLIRVVALSAAGLASAEATVSVTVEDADRLVVPDSGDLQVTQIGTPATDPLVAKVFTLVGGTPVPVVGATVTFEIVDQPFFDPGLAQTGGFLGGVAGQTSVQVTTNGTGLASTTLTVASTFGDEQGVLQPTVVAARVEKQFGGPAVFKVVGLPSGNLVPGSGAPGTMLVLGATQCVPIAGSPLGDCPLGEAGETLTSPFGVIVLDQNFQVLGGADVTFSVAAGSQGAFVGAVVVTTDFQGVARSSDFTLGQTIDDQSFIQLHDEDVAATQLEQHIVEATVDSITRPMAAFARAGPPATVEDVSTSTTGGIVELVAEGRLDVVVKDSFGNTVPNAEVTFTAGPGAKVIRFEPEFSTAPPCAFRIPFADDPCAVNAISASTFSFGTTSAHMVLGNQAATQFKVTASAGGASVEFLRSTDPVNIADTSQREHTLQAAFTQAAMFAIIGTENNDEDHITAVAWEIKCDDIAPPIGQCDQTFSADRVVGQAIRFAITAGGAFSPLSVVSGTQNSIDGGGRVAVRAPEVGTLMTGGPQESAATGETATIAAPGIGLSLQLGASFAKPEVAFVVERVVHACALEPTMTSGVFCRRTASQTPCKPAGLDPVTLVDEGPGVHTYVDLTDGETENNVLVVLVQHPSTSPAPGRTAKKFERELTIQDDTPFRTPGTDFSYFNLVANAPGRPGFYHIDKVSSVGAPRLSQSAPRRHVVPLTSGSEGCVELVAKSYKRTQNDLEELPPNVHLSFLLPDGSNISGGAIEVRSGLTKVGQESFGSGWADEIIRARRTPAEVTNELGREGLLGPNGVADWAEMRAWKIYETPPAGDVPEPDTRFQPSGISVAAGEPAEVYGTVSHVGTQFEKNAGVAVTFFNPRTALGGIRQEIVGATHDQWGVEPLVEFNLLHAELRTDTPSAFRFFVDQDPGNDVTVLVKKAFSNFAAHESRHAWQMTLLKQTNTPPGTTYAEDTPDGTPPANLTPDNNDDWREKDCRPERAQLEGSIRRLSGAEIEDSTTTRDLDGATPPNPFGSAAGENPGIVPADVCSSVGEARSVGRIMWERDAARFAMALFGEGFSQ